MFSFKIFFHRVSDSDARVLASGYVNYAIKLRACSPVLLSSELIGSSTSSPLSCFPDHYMSHRAKPKCDAPSLFGPSLFFFLFYFGFIFSVKKLALPKSSEEEKRDATPFP